MSKTVQVDVAIIGVGTAGMSAYRAARAHTDRVVTIEAAVYGTTCARVGCMPSKLLIAAAEVAHQIGQAPMFGIEAAPMRIDGEAVMRRVRAERDRFVGFVVDAVEDWPPAHRLKGHARFVGPQALVLDGGTRIEADRIVIATGSSPEVPDAWREALGDRVIINDDVFYWHRLPQSVAVAGTGVIGLEIAQALARLGVRVRLFGRSGRIGPLTDPEVQKQARAIVGEALPLSAQAKVTDVARDADGVVLHYEEDGETRCERFDYLLAATGRRPNLAGLDLAAAGIAVDAKGMPAFDRYTGQIGDSRIFIAGDVTDAHPLLHEAADDGRIAGDNAGRYPDVRVRPRRAALSIVFSDPQIMLAGARFIDLQQSGTPFGIGMASFDDQGRSRVMGRNRGVIRVYGEVHSGRFLGAEMIGPAAEHIGHLLSWAVQHRLTVQQMLDSPFYHPVVEEGVRTALRRLNRELHMGPVPVEQCLDCGPGG